MCLVRLNLRFLEWGNGASLSESISPVEAMAIMKVWQVIDSFPDGHSMGLEFHSRLARGKLKD